MTRVDECTKAETGVGAAIAAGSQLEKGIWALLVIPATIIKRAIVLLKGLFQNRKDSQCPC